MFHVFGGTAQRADDHRLVGVESIVTANVDHQRCRRRAQTRIKISGRNKVGISVHTQSPRKNECCAELGRCAVWRGACISPYSRVSIVYDLLQELAARAVIGFRSWL